jgi:hypothetical protein
MNFGNRQPGTSVTFVDGVSQESILKLESDADGVHFVAFHLYDSQGVLVQEQDALERGPEGVLVRAACGEMLLTIPKDDTKSIQYNLYNHEGTRLATSDGVHTKIYPLLRMESVGKSGVYPRRQPAQTA